MAAGAMDAARIRELLLDFYQEHDPQRLAMGLDVFSMVIWTQKNGIDALNELLEEQYGVGIDPNKRLGGANQDFKRFSTLMATKDVSDEVETRRHIHERLLAFYEAHDPSKIPRVADFVQYIMMHGLEAFNRKLMNKYGETISLDEDAMSSEPAPSAPAPPPRVKAPPPAPPKRRSKKRVPPPAPEPRHDEEDPAEAGAAHGDEEEDDDDLDLPPPPPPTMSMVAGEGLDVTRKKLRDKLETYYLDHDPAKLTHLDAIVEWGLGIGEAELEEKLIQLYGSGFESERKTSVVENVRRSLQSVASAAGRLRKPVKPTPPAGAARQHKPPAPRAPKPRAPAHGASPSPEAMNSGFGRGGGGSFAGVPASRPSAAHNKPPAPRKKPQKPPAPWGVVDPSARPGTIVRAETADNEDMPCGYYELDLTGASFGMCKCGYSRLAHVKGSPEYRRAAEARDKRNGSVVARNARKFEPTQQQAVVGVEPREHAGVYMYKTTHDAKDQPKRADVVAHGGEKGGDRACGNFKLDLMSTSYGVCECGFPRDQHKAAASNPAAAGRAARGGLAKRLSRRAGF